MIALDLFCGGGGAGMGYRRAGYDVVGVDVANHSRSYSHVGLFRQMSWEEGLARYASESDLIHASPPCQHYSRLTKGHLGLASTKPDLVHDVREALIAAGKPYVIENVGGAPLRHAFMLCCWTFGYETYRHRYFETSHHVPDLFHRPHTLPTSRSPRWRPGTFITVSGHCTPIPLARKVMDINWMLFRELVEAIPPYMTEYIGKALRSSGEENVYARGQDHASDSERVLCL